VVDITHPLNEQVIVRALILGGIGGACGYFGPIYLDPGTAQGPLVGIFVTGPFGLLLGAGLGLLFHRLSLSLWLRESIFISVGLLLAAGVLFLVQPGDEPAGFLVDVEIVKCEHADARAESAATRWADTALHNPQLEQRPAWRASIAQLLRDDPGVVLTVKVWRRREIYLPTKHSAQRQWKPGPWTFEQYPDAYFARYAGNRCSDYSIGIRDVYWIHVEHSTEFPPANPPALVALRHRPRSPRPGVV
jgi:hypothetical protein